MKKSKNKREVKMTVAVPDRKKALDKLKESLADKKFEYDKKDIDYFKPLMSWGFLDPKLKSSNMHQARFIEHMLNKKDLRIIKVSDPDTNTLKDSKLIEQLAVIEHSRWNAERLMAGWRYTSKKDINKKLTPYLLVWGDLSDDTKKWDRNAVKKFPSILASVGYEIQPK